MLVPTTGNSWEHPAEGPVWSSWRALSSCQLSEHESCSDPLPTAVPAALSSFSSEL